MDKKIEGICGHCGNMYFQGTRGEAAGELLQCEQCGKTVVTLCPKCKCLTHQIHGEGITSDDRHYVIEKCTNCGFEPIDESALYMEIEW